MSLRDEWTNLQGITEAYRRMTADKHLLHCAGRTTYASKREAQAAINMARVVGKGTPYRCDEGGEHWHIKRERGS